MLTIAQRKWLATCKLRRAVAESKRVIDIATGAILKVLATVVIVWLWLQLWQLVMVLLVGIFVVIALDLAAGGLEARRIPSAAAAGGLVLLLTRLIVAFSWTAGSFLVDHSRE